MRHEPIHNLIARGKRLRVEVASLVNVVWVCMLATLLILGSFGGVSIFAHSHDGHGLHLHAASTETQAMRLAASHLAHHRSLAQTHDHGHDHGCVLAEEVDPRSDRDELGHELASLPIGVLVSLPDCDVVKVPPTTVPHFPTLVGDVVAFGVAVLAAPVQIVARYECDWGAKPRHLHDLCPCARIVRTSGALLI